MKAVRLELESGPKTAVQIGTTILASAPTIGQRSATNRAYQALLRLESRGYVSRDGKLWSLV